MRVTCVSHVSHVTCVRDKLLKIDTRDFPWVSSTGSGFYSVFISPYLRWYVSAWLQPGHSSWSAGLVGNLWDGSPNWLWEKIKPLLPISDALELQIRISSMNAGSWILHGDTGWHEVVHGVTWCYVVIHGDTWRYMVIHADTWWYMVIHGDTWRYMVIHGDTWWYKCLIYSWWYMVIQGRLLIQKDGRRSMMQENYKK